MKKPLKLICALCLSCLIGNYINAQNNAKQVFQLSQNELNKDYVLIDTLICKPPVYELITKIVLVRKAEVKWVKAFAPHTCCLGASRECKVWTLVNIPAEYKTVVTEKLVKGE